MVVIHFVVVKLKTLFWLLMTDTSLKQVNPIKCFKGLETDFGRKQPNQFIIVYRLQ